MIEDGHRNLTVEGAFAICRLAGASMVTLSELTSSAGLIFSGTVIKIGESAVPELPARKNLLVVRVDRGLRVDPGVN